MSVSEGFQEIDSSDAEGVAREFDQAWTAPDMARQQRELCDRELLNWKSGREVAPFRAYTSLLMRHARGPAELLDVGCGCGIYASVVRHAGWTGIYHGCDYSEAMIAVATEREPHGYFRWGDARRLPFADARYDVVVSGCVLLHLDDWPGHVAECARVSRRHVMLHRTPLVDGPSRYFTKLAYGVRVFETWIGRAALADALRCSGLRLVEAEVVSPAPSDRSSPSWESVWCAKENPQ